jgi:hypothetical protein
MLWTAPTLRHPGAIGWLRRNESLEGEPSVGAINLKTAKTPGLAVSLHLQQLTDEVID